MPEVDASEPAGSGACGRRSRATAMPVEDRRQAILTALVPLLAQRGAELSTREIAEAAGVAEGTIFRAFQDKRALLLAAAQEAVNPAEGELVFDEVMAGGSTLRVKVVLVTRHVQERMRLTMSVLVAVRSTLMSVDRVPGADGPQRQDGPPEFVLEAQELLHRRLTGLFEPHRFELGVTPEAAAVALRSLIFGSAWPEFGMATLLTPEQIADLLLCGVCTRGAAACC
ncbi:MAG TPA: helix-turn-helix domain-containing protein [Mycobacteriales bacterium]